MSRKNIPIKEVMELPLWIVICTIHWVGGSQGDHQDSQSHMLYTLEDMAPTTYNWVKDLLSVFKEQLTKFR